MKSSFSEQAALPRQLRGWSSTQIDSVCERLNSSLAVWGKGWGIDTQALKLKLVTGLLQEKLISEPNDDITRWSSFSKLQSDLDSVGSMRYTTDGHKALKANTEAAPEVLILNSFGYPLWRLLQQQNQNTEAEQLQLNAPTHLSPLSSDIALKLGQSFLKEFLSHFLTQTQGTVLYPELTKHISSAVPFQTWSGDVLCTMSLFEHHCFIYCPGEIFQRLVQVQSKTGHEATRLTSNTWTEVLKKRKTRWLVRLHSASLTLSELSSLKPGSILALPHKLDEAGYVVSLKEEVICHADLGRHDDCRAIAIA